MVVAVTQPVVLASAMRTFPSMSGCCAWAELDEYSLCVTRDGSFVFGVSMNSCVLGVFVNVCKRVRQELPQNDILCLLGISHNQFVSATSACKYCTHTHTHTHTHTRTHAEANDTKHPYSGSTRCERSSTNSQTAPTLAEQVLQQDNASVSAEAPKPVAGGANGDVEPTGGLSAHSDSVSIRTRSQSFHGAWGAPPSF
eukprot:scaffold82855_cov19-Tisochrysis_lutea.AAC.1